MRLIDANKLDFSFDRRIFGEADENYARGADDAIGVVNAAPTINPESLQIVQELRKQLAKVTAERDAAIKYLKIAADDNGRCYGCKWLNEATEACTHKLGMEACDSVSNNMWEWKGI